MHVFTLILGVLATVCLVIVVCMAADEDRLDVRYQVSLFTGVISIIGFFSLALIFWP